jgi:hypothetical protein
MLAIAAFDKICQGPGDRVITRLVSDPSAFPRLFQGEGAEAMGDWPMIDRTLWPKSVNPEAEFVNPWPLEVACGWGPGPVATLIADALTPEGTSVLDAVVTREP